MLCLVFLFPFGTNRAYADSLPENYNFFSGIPFELANPGGSLPGSNDFDCKPTIDHPRPVLLMHGTGGSQQTNWGSYVPMLKNAGFCVFAPTYGTIPGAQWPISAIGGMAPIEDSAEQFGIFIDQVLAATGAPSMDIIGHSQGTIIPQYYTKVLGGSAKITNYISLAPLWLGTKAFGAEVVPKILEQLGLPNTAIPLCQACGQITPESEIIMKINADGTPYLRGITYTNISTRYDELVSPFTQGQVAGLPGYTVKNIVVQDDCEQDYSEHAGVAGSQRAAVIALNALDPEHPHEVPCLFSSPFTG
ncbi:MAG: esterase/lipase family protein [Mycobacteriaceae bacterium]